MAKIKPSKQEREAKKSFEKNKNATKSLETESPEQLYAETIDLVQSQPGKALEKAQMLWNQVQNGSTLEKLPALGLLGEISETLGEIDNARAYFEKAVELDPEGKESNLMEGGAEKFLWLAQLCEQGGKASIGWFERGVRVLEREIAALGDGATTGLDRESLLVLRVDKQKKLADALCGMVEVYMTDLSWEEDAESRCENLITKAIAVEDEPSPGVLQTLASVRLSQQREDDARSALIRSIQSWKHLDPEDPGVPDFATRISLCRLLMEAEMERDAMHVITRLVDEDDESVEAWYLGGWCQYLIAEKLQSNGKTEEQSRRQAALKGSRHFLKKSLKLYSQLSYEDEQLFAHAKELVSKLDEILGPEAEHTDGSAEDEEWENWDGFSSSDDEDEEMVDG
ncbi:hypothetical protein K470DRAFT_212172 [Piedraia hortae CBS 480.64]|uniref:Uncharacterized protein n=1 Tax=Piedraia hortae CBS 480.64 TaxID=1314780 RepID=A0A6A7C840_9PEZI|nr:hypothetical protein K470DRAFT_212172 [Piedraia hortae CBS 480.64]